MNGHYYITQPNNMIIFYNRKTGEVIGAVEGRWHDEHTTNSIMIYPEGVDPSDIVKEIVEFLPVHETVKTPQGLKTKVKDFVANSPIREHVRKFEKKELHILDHKVTLDKKGKIAGFTKNKKLL